MTDKLGVPVDIGDLVAYTTGAQSNTWLDLGIVVSMTTHSVMIVSDSGKGRKLSNSRSSDEILSTIPTKTLHPELFV